MKICHLTSVHNRNDTRIFVKELPTFIKAGYSVNIIVADGKGEEERNKIYISDVGSPRNRIFRIIFTTRKVYKKAHKINADVYHFHDPELIPAGLKLIKSGKKVIYDVHEDVPRQILSKHWIPVFVRKKISRIFEKYEDRAASKLSSIITATDVIRDRFIVNNKHCCSVKNYPDLNEFPSPGPFKDRKNEIVYIGSITRVRGVFEMVRSLKWVDTQFNLAGDFQPVSIHEEIEKLPGWEKVNELGNVYREQARILLDRSRVGLVTLHPIVNYLDALPVKMFEYMAAGIPVVTSDFKLYKHIIESDNCGICVDPLNPQQIADAINYLLNNEEVAEEMGKNGRRAVEEKYNWESEGKKLIEFYNKL